jgi:Phage tail assembly chaperone proteins, E, or 41 or 14
MKTIKLIYPIESNGSTISEVKIRRPKVRDIRSIKKSQEPIESEVTLLSNLCEMTPEEIESLDMEDYGQLQSALQVFLGTSEK